MRFLTVFLAGLSCVALNAVGAGGPRGSLLELHSCELYAGGCIVSSEATLGGRYMLRAWKISDGMFNGVNLAGLNVAALQSSTENLADSKAAPGQTVIYLPSEANSNQRAALLAWITSSQPELGATQNLQTRIIPIQFTRTDNGYALKAGESISVQTAPLESCATGACGEALWYSPRAQTSVFTVAVDRSSEVREPLLKLTWNDSGRRTVFLGKFGESAGERLFVSSSELCGATSRLF